MKTIIPFMCNIMHVDLTDYQLTKEDKERIHLLSIVEKKGLKPLNLENLRLLERLVEKKDYGMRRQGAVVRIMEILGETLKGGYAEYVTVSEDFATKIPSEMKSEYAAPLFCAGVTAYGSIRASEPAPGRKIGIFGIGGVGHMAIQFGKLEKLEMIAVSRNQKHLDLAKRLGAAHTASYSNATKTLDDIKSKIGLLDAAIVFAPSDNVTELAINSVKKGGLVNCYRGRNKRIYRIR